MDYVVAVGGTYGPADRNMVQMYHIQEDNWTVRNNFSYPLTHGIGFVLDQSRFFIHGGVRGANIPADSTFITEYDFENDAWIRGVELHKAHKFAFAIVYNQ